MSSFVPLFDGGDNMEWTEFTKKLTEKCIERGIPSSASFELTPFCNFSCNMCYIRLSPEQALKQGKPLSTDQWIRIAKETKTLGTLGLEVTGGEAITRPDFPLLYETFIKLGFLVSLRSNGYLLRERNLELLLNYRPRNVSITLYGGSDDTYQKICGVDDGFSVVTRNIITMREAGITPKLTVTLTKDNIGDRTRLIEWAEKNEFHITFFGGLITPIRSAKRSVKHLKVEYGKDLVIPDIDNLPRSIPERDKYMSPFWMCREYGAKFSVSWDGHMTLCNCLPSIWSDALSQSVACAYKSLYDQLNRIHRPSDCAICNYIDYCGSCPARLLSETGDHEKTCKSLCNKAKISYYLSTVKESENLERNESFLNLKCKERDEINEN